ncbi:MAG: bifunctional sulfate adenylyltransferase/adenylylsulfate kinase, partial [Acidobacteriota bacterium]|nr:bifunctional sulfate adenylyltransferase/adenylylsulfate kinase [Acidobacteriota bacterium]
NRERAEEIKGESKHLPSWDLTPRQLCDLELLLTGGFSPLQGFMTRPDYERVCREMRLASGVLWPMPVTLDVTEDFAGRIARNGKIALRDPEGSVLAVLHVEDVWKADREAEAKSVFKTQSTAHAGVAYLFDRANPWYVGGRLEGIRLPPHYDFRALRLTPAELRGEFTKLGWRKVVAFQTRNPMHRAHQELTLRAAKKVEASLLIHPSVGMTKPGDVEYYVRVRCYQAMLPKYPKDTVRLSLLPLAMRMGGPREAVWHAIIRKNHGCTHFVVGRDHAGPGKDRDGKPFYGPYEAQELLRSHEAELGVAMVPFQMLVYLEDKDTYVPEPEVPAGARVLNISGTELRKRLAEGRDLPSWFTFPEVARELQKSYPPRHRQGFTVFFTGLPGSGKSTIASVLRVKFLEMGGRPVSLLDGDEVRRQLSPDAGNSKENLAADLRRVGFVASEITKNGGIAICAAADAGDSVGKELRAQIQPHGGFVMVHLSATREIREARYRKASNGSAGSGAAQSPEASIGASEPPGDATLTFDTGEITPEEAAQEIFLHLEREGYIGVDRQAAAAQ